MEGKGIPKLEEVANVAETGLRRLSPQQAQDEADYFLGDMLEGFRAAVQENPLCYRPLLDRTLDMFKDHPTAQEIIRAYAELLKPEPQKVQVGGLTFYLNPR